MTDILNNGTSAESVLSIVSSGGTTTLTASSATIIRITGTLAHTIVLPVGTSMFKGQRFVISNKSTLDVTVNYQNATLFTTVTGGADSELRLFDNTTANGNWSSLFSSGGSLNLKNGGIETAVNTSDTAYTVLNGKSNFHPFMHVQSGHTITIASGARLVSTEDTIDGTVVVSAGGIWKVL